MAWEISAATVPRKVTHRTALNTYRQTLLSVRCTVYRYCWRMVRTQKIFSRRNLSWSQYSFHSEIDKNHFPRDPAACPLWGKWKDSSKRLSWLEGRSQKLTSIEGSVAGLESSANAGRRHSLFPDEICLLAGPRKKNDHVFDRETQQPRNGQALWYNKRSPGSSSSSTEPDKLDSGRIISKINRKRVCSLGNGGRNKHGILQSFWSLNYVCTIDWL